MPEALARLGGYDAVLVQGGLYPHAGYDAHVQLLTPHDVRALEGKRVAILLARRGSTYPLKQEEWKCLIDLPPLASMPDGLLAVPLTPEAGRCMEEHR